MTVKRKTIKSHNLEDGVQFVFANMAAGKRFIVVDTVFYQNAAAGKPIKKMLPYNEDVVIFTRR